MMSFEYVIKILENKRDELKKSVYANDLFKKEIANLKKAIAILRSPNRDTGKEGE